MGFSLNPFKLVKKVFKGIKKVFKKVIKGVKKFLNSKLGRILLIAAAVYFGGAALGYWNNAFAASSAGAGSTVASAQGITSGAEMSSLAAGSTGASGSATAAMSAAEGAKLTAGDLLASGGIGGNSAGLASTVGAQAGNAGLAAGSTGVTAGTTGTALTVAEAAKPAVNTLVAEGSKQAAGSTFLGTMKSTAGKVATWMGKNPVPTMMIGSALSSAFTPEPESQSEAFARMEEEKRRNSTVAGKKYDGSGPGIDMARLDQILQKYRPRETQPQEQQVAAAPAAPAAQMAPRRRGEGLLQGYAPRYT